MILQPLVENSSKTGSRAQVGGRAHPIKTARPRRPHRIEVHDDGLGLTEERASARLGDGPNGPQATWTSGAREFTAAKLSHEAPEVPGEGTWEAWRFPELAVAGGGSPPNRCTSRGSVARPLHATSRYLLGQIGGVDVVGRRATASGHRASTDSAPTT